MKDNVLVLLFVGIPFCVVLSMTAKVDSYWSDPWLERDAVVGEKKWVKPEGPDRWSVISLDGKPLDDKSTGTVIVKAVYAGDKVPLQTPIDMGAFGRCVNQFAEFPKSRQVNTGDKTVPWAFAYVKSGLPSGLSYGIARARELHQLGCVYRPHVMGLLAGQEVWVYNMEDEEAHNVVAKEGGAVLFNQGQPAQGKEIRAAGDLGAQFGLQLKCELHPWMSGRVNILAHPYFCTTINTRAKDKEGKETEALEHCQGEIKRLPPGTYTLGVWHESFAGSDVKVTVKAGETTTVTIELK